MERQIPVIATYGGGKNQPIHQTNGPVASGSLGAMMVTPANTADLARPWSNHANGVNVAVADGGTRFITDSVDMQVWQALLTPACGEVADDPNF